MEMWKTLRVSYIPTPSAATTDKLQTRRYTNNLLGTKDLGRTLPVVELRHQCLRIATRSYRCRDSVDCITAIQSRPNNFQLRTELLRCQDRREIHARILAVEPLPRASGDAQSGRRPRHAKRCLPRRRLLHQRLGGV